MSQTDSGVVQSGYLSVCGADGMRYVTGLVVQIGNHRGIFLESVGCLKWVIMSSNLDNFRACAIFTELLSPFSYFKGGIPLILPPLSLPVVIALDRALSCKCMDNIQHCVIITSAARGGIAS